MNDNNSVSGEGKESQSDNLWPFVGHFLKDHHNSTTILKAAALAKVLMLSCTNFPEKIPAPMFSIQYNEAGPTRSFSRRQKDLDRGVRERGRPPIS